MGSAGAQLATMYSKIKTTFFQSLIVMPLMVTNILSGVPVSATITTGEMNSTNSAVTPDVRAEKIDQYFKSYNMPLAGYGQKMVEVADKNDIDWRLIPALAVIESTGGKFACKSVTFSAFGWGSCKIGFKSYDQAIEVLGTNLGGNNPNTEKHYANKDTKGILAKYNSVIPNYTAKVMKVMDAIEKTEVK
jgi:hypothetical protein